MNSLYTRIYRNASEAESEAESSHDGRVGPLGTGGTPVSRSRLMEEDDDERWSDSSPSNRGGER